MSSFVFLSFSFFWFLFHFCFVEELQRNLLNFMDLGVVASVLHEEPSPTSVTTTGANDYDNYICSAFCLIFQYTYICTPLSIFSSPQGCSWRKSIQSCIYLNLGTLTSINFFGFSVPYQSSDCTCCRNTFLCVSCYGVLASWFHANNRMQHDNGCDGVHVHAWANCLCV